MNGPRGMPDQNEQGHNAHPHEKLKWPPRRSVARVGPPGEEASDSLDTSERFAGFAVKPGEERRPCLANDLFTEPRKSFPSKIMSSLASTPSIFLRPGSARVSPPWSFQRFPLRRDKPSTSTSGAEGSAGLPALAESRHSAAQNWRFVSRPKA